MAQKAEEARQIARLHEEQKRAIQQTKERIDILEKFKKDYIALKDRLITLPEKISHDIMVPFGKLAFMPGRLVHTNEVLVLLGDNWFAEMSAKQATQTVDRRIGVLDEQLTELHKQGGLLEPRLDFTSELQDMAEARGDLVEIKEEYDEEKEKAWREQHRKNVAAYNQQRKIEEQRAKEEVNRKQEMCTDAELWERLAQLEKLEEEAGEMNIDSSETESEESSEDEETVSSNTRKIRWQDEGPKPRDRNKTITFSHTQTQPTSKSEEALKLPPDRVLDSSSSPGDIYTHFRGQGPKSILKPSTTQGESSTETTTSDVDVKEKREIQAGSMEAFSGAVVEKSVITSENKGQTSAESSAQTPRTKQTDTQTTEQSNSQTQRPVSRFKAQRMAKK